MMRAHISETCIVLRVGENLKESSSVKLSGSINAVTQRVN